MAFFIFAETGLLRNNKTYEHQHFVFICTKKYSNDGNFFDCPKFKRFSVKIEE